MSQETPANGLIQWLTPEVGWLRLPIPLGVDHINVWLLAEEDGFTLVDTGVYSLETINIWERLFESELVTMPLKRIILTHRHTDHTGMTGWLTEQTGAVLWMNDLEFEAAYYGQINRDHSDAVSFYRQAGWPEELCRSLPDYYTHAQSWVSPLPPLTRTLSAGEAISIGRNRWQILIGQGHCEGHVCLYCAEKNVLIAGDQVLPDVSANVSVSPEEPAANPLRQWFASMEQFYTLPSDVLVLPAHGGPYNDLHARVHKQVSARQKAVKRLQALDSVGLPVTLFSTLYKRPINPKSHAAMLMATGEAVAYTNYLLPRVY